MVSSVDISWGQHFLLSSIKGEKVFPSITWETTILLPLAFFLMSDEKLEFHATLLLPWTDTQVAKSTEQLDMIWSQSLPKQAKTGVTGRKQVKMKEDLLSCAQTPACLPALYLALLESC